MQFNAKKMSLVIQKSVRKLCTLPYHNHPKGCPNFGKRPDCPPNQKLLTTIYDLSHPFYVLWVDFDIGTHIRKMEQAHPLWTKYQTACCLYWQPKVRKFLREEAAKWTQTHPEYTFSDNPEAMGVNVTATMKNEGIILEWPPKNIVRKIGIAGVKK